MTESKPVAAESGTKSKIYESIELMPRQTHPATQVKMIILFKFLKTLQGSGTIPVFHQAYIINPGNPETMQ